jgi:hypothetical protein
MPCYEPEPYLSRERNEDAKKGARLLCHLISAQLQIIEGPSPKQLLAWFLEHRKLDLQIEQNLDIRHRALDRILEIENDIRRAEVTLIRIETAEKQFIRAKKTEPMSDSAIQ